MLDLDQLIKELTESSNLSIYIREFKNSNSKCNDNKTTNHHDCIVKENDAELPKPQCPVSFIHILMKVLASQPKLLDDSARDAVVFYFRSNKIKAEGLVTVENLSLLNQSKSQLMTWLKYELLLIQLIKEQIYEPKTMANETLVIVKSELGTQIASKFSSVLNTCVKHCRESNRHNVDEEEEEKWCEIIDWMSWFIVSDEDSFT